jgi:hypothetical protein
MEIVKLKREHFDSLEEQAATRYLSATFTPDVFETLESSPYSYAVLDGGRTLVCGGVIQYWENRGEAWAMLARDCRAQFVGIHSAAKRLLQICPIRRIEAVVDCGFVPGHRWVQALGFEIETPVMRHYRPTGGDCAKYVRVR